MEFDYDSAKARVSKELAELTEELWPEIQPIYKKDKWETPENKADAVYSKMRHVKDEQKRKKFSMLYELNQECFWHATDSWPDIRKTLEKEDEDFYATLMLEQAQRVQAKFGYTWIVESYDNGNLRDYISDDLLKEAVNKGFWEIANEYFVTSGIVPPWESYATLMKYKDLLDLSRVAEFKKEILKARGSDWPDQDYSECFERARENLSAEDGARLARPMIEQIISWALSWENPKDDPKEVLAKELEPYKEYLCTSAIQELLKETVNFSVKHIGGEEAYHDMVCIEILTEYLNLPEDELREFISSSISKDGHRIEKILVDVNFPRKWLNSDILSLMRAKIIEHLDEPLQDWQGKEIIPHLNFLQKATQREFLDAEFGKERIKSGLEDYLAKKRRPGGAPVAALLNTLNPELIEEQEIYRAVVHQGITDLVKRNKVEEASTWYKKAEKAGWLDKSKIPEFELRLPTLKNFKTVKLPQEAEEQPGKQAKLDFFNNQNS